MPGKLKLISTSVVITIITSIMIITDKASTNPFFTLLKIIRNKTSKLTFNNPFKKEASINLNRPSSNGRLSSNTPSNNLWARLKGFFTHNNSKSFKISTSGTINPAFQNDEKSSTTTHILKGNQEKVSKSKEKRTYLMSKYDEITLSTKNIQTSINDKNLNQETNVSITEESQTSSSAKILNINSKLKSMLTILDDKLDYKSVIEDSINKTNNPNVKVALYKHLDNTESEIMALQIKVHNTQTLLEIIQNNN